jgi:putative zinc finger protein
MKCENAQEFFSDYIEATLDKPSLVALEAHLTACASCQQGVEGLRQTWDALKAVPEIEPPKDLAWRVLAQLQQERAERLEAERRRPNPFFGWLQSLTPGAAFGYAVLVALLVVGLAFPLTGHVPGLPSVTFGGLGRGATLAQPMPAPMITMLDARPDAQDGQWYYQLVVTAPSRPAESQVSVSPMVSTGGQLSRTGELPPSRLVAGNSLAIRVPVTVAEGPVQAVTVRVSAPGWIAFEKQVPIPNSAQRPGF